MKKLSVFTMVFLIVCISTSVSYSEYYWAKTFGGTGIDVAESIIKTTDGGFLVSGIANYVGPGEFDWSITKVGSNGEIIWQKTFGASIGRLWSSSLQQTTDGNYIVTGYTDSFGAGDRDAWILKFDSGGEILWLRAYGGSDRDVLWSIQQTADNGYITAGYTGSFGVGNSGDVWVMKLHANGDIMWQKTYGGNGGEGASTILQTSDGGYIVTGGTNSFTLNYEYSESFVLKLDNSGNISWIKTYGYDYGHSIDEVPGEGYILGGSPENYPDGWAYRLVKLDYSGNAIWDKLYGPYNLGGPYFYEYTSDGGYIIGGVHPGTFGLVVKLDSSGNVEWHKTYGSQEYLTLYSIKQTTDGSFMLAGFARFEPSEPGDAIILKVDSSGDIPDCDLIGVMDLLYSEKTTVEEDVIFTAQSSTPTITDTTIVFQNTLVVTSDVCCFDDASDSDQDGVGDLCDNCPNHLNPLQEDTFPPQGNGIGDVCECEGNFDCDEDCDGTDASTFKVDFGRNTFGNPCESSDPCNGDFDCDHDCDGTDAALFKQDFGRSSFNTPCPTCEVEVWCSYPSP